MNPTMKILIMVLFLIKDISCPSPPRSPPKRYYDITKFIDKSITKLFKSVKGMAVAQLLQKIENLMPHRYESNTSAPIEPFQNKMIFRDVIIQTCTTRRRWKVINYEFFNNKLEILFHPEIKFRGYIDITNDSNYGRFDCTMLSSEKCSMSVVKLSENHLNKTFHVDLSIPEESEFEILSIRMHRSDENKRHTTAEFEKEMKFQMPKLLADNMNHNEKLLRSLSRSYGFSPKRHIIAKRHSFLDHPERYFYLIPFAFFYCFDLKNLTIIGLSNFHSLKYKHFRKNLIHTLLIKNVYGSTTLDYGYEAEPPLELKFSIDYLSISMDMDKAIQDRGMQVAAQWSSVIRTKDNVPLTTIQSEGIIHAIELAIADSLMPEIETWRLDELRSPMGQKCSEISQSSDWEELKKVYKKWIPFNEL